MILINGCSYTHGTRFLEGRNWTSYFSEMVGKNVTNIAQSGSNWQSICMSTVEWCLNNRKNPKSILIALPAIFRFNFPTIPDHHLQSESNRPRTKDTSIFVSPTLSDNDDGLREIYWNRHPYNWIWHIEQCLHAIHYLALFCESRNIKLHIIYLSEVDMSQIINNLATYSKDFNDLCESYGIDKNEAVKSFDQHHLIDIASSYNMFPRVKHDILMAMKYNGHLGLGMVNGKWDSHFDTDGHKWLAQHIYNKYAHDIDHDFDDDDIERIKSKMKEHPECVNDRDYDWIKMFVDSGVKSFPYKIKHEDGFVYD